VLGQASPRFPEAYHGACANRKLADLRGEAMRVNVLTCFHRDFGIRFDAQSSTSAIVFFLAMLPAFAAQAAQPGAFVTFLAGQKPGQGKTFACFTRNYDAAHLVAPPDQRVTAVRMLATVYSNLDYGYQLRLGLNVRDRQAALESVAECGNGQVRDRLDRAAICAGIGGKVRLAIENRNVVQLSLPLDTNLWAPGPNQKSDIVQNAFAEDDKHFRLTRAPLSQCDDQALDAEEKALLDRDR
jgi:hypothetical protein